jgi:biotin-[acetyl-CoA-carboxylase] ligase BirA-like protein
MKLPEGPRLRLEETESTQKVAAQALLDGLSPSAILTRKQTHGRGRFNREWVAEPGSSLAVSLIFTQYAGHPRPWLIGMSVAAAAAAVLHCQVQWPNDVTLQGKKLGGILTDMLPDKIGRSIPVVGVGVNLGPMDFPAELAHKRNDSGRTQRGLPRPGDHAQPPLRPLALHAGTRKLASYRACLEAV